MVFKDQEKKQVPATKDIVTKKSCSGHTLVRLTGLEVCGDVAYPHNKDDYPPFPLSGPAHGVLVLYKRDSHKGYQIEINQINVSLSYRLHTISTDNYWYTYGYI